MVSSWGIMLARIVESILVSDERFSGSGISAEHLKIGGHHTYSIEVVESFDGEFVLKFSLSELICGG